MHGPLPRLLCKGSSQAEASRPSPCGSQGPFSSSSREPSLPSQEARCLPRGHLCSALPLSLAGSVCLMALMTPFRTLSPLLCLPSRFLSVAKVPLLSLPKTRVHLQCCPGPKPGLAVSPPQLQLPPTSPLWGEGQEGTFGILSLSSCLCSPLPISQGSGQCADCGLSGPTL